MTRFLREPLLWFVVIGAGLFALSAWLGDEASGEEPGEILVTEGRLQNLAAVFEKTWRRQPTPEEMRRLVRDHLLEEVLYREGVRLGLDQDDTVIRRRVRQKMEFVVDDVLETPEPTEQDLEAWLAAHPDDYASPTMLTFRHVFFSAERRGSEMDRDVQEALAALRHDPGREDWPELGDTFLLGYAFDEMPVEGIAGQFGPEFASAIAAQPPGAWSGPVESSLGSHLVRVDARVEGGESRLDEVREAVERDWRFAQRQAARQQFEDELLGRYRVKIEGLDEPGGGGR